MEPISYERVMFYIKIIRTIVMLNKEVVISKSLCLDPLGKVMIIRLWYMVPLANQFPSLNGMSLNTLNPTFRRSTF